MPVLEGIFSSNCVLSFFLFYSLRNYIVVAVSLMEYVNCLWLIRVVGRECLNLRI